MGIFFNGNRNYRMLYEADDSEEDFTDGVDSAADGDDNGESEEAKSLDYFNAYDKVQGRIITIGNSNNSTYNLTINNNSGYNCRFRLITNTLKLIPGDSASFVCKKAKNEIGDSIDIWEEIVTATRLKELIQ